MRVKFAMFAILNSTTVWANSTPIEPVLVPIINQAENINVQMSKYEVTVKEFMRFVNATGYKGPEKCYLYTQSHLPSDEAGTWSHAELIDEPYKPVVCIGTKGAMEYAQWLADTTGKPYRLPEFNEWYFAASQGQSSRFAFGEDLNHREMCEYENIEDAANNAGLKQHHNYRYRFSADCNDGAIYHTVVGMYRPNSFGLYDMVGNVRELLQTCNAVNKEKPKQCQQYSVVGSGWHWVPRPVDIDDNIEPDFIGSIEGFRLVLDSAKSEPISKQTRMFLMGLTKAQQHASIEHARLKSLPKRVKGVAAKLAGEKQVQLSWSDSEADQVTYTVYRSYIDDSGKLSRKMTIIAEGLRQARYVDELPGTGAASYQIFANNPVGESQPSAEVFVGKHQQFAVGQRIAAQAYHEHRNSIVIEKDKTHSVVFSPNERHFPSESKLIPFEPAWLTYNFLSKRAGKATLSMSIRGEPDAEFELWQGRHLVAKVTFEGSREFVQKTFKAELIQSHEPLQIRQANKRFFVLDWFKLDHQ